MSRLKDSSEIQMARDLIQELVAKEAVPPLSTLPSSGVVIEARPIPSLMPEVAPEPPPIKPLKPARPDSPLPQPVGDDGSFRGDRLEQALYAMCERGGFQGAVIADLDGLPLAVYNSPVAPEAMAAFTTVLGDALAKAGKLLEQHQANNISMDINYTDKVVLSRFMSGETPSYLMIIAPQEVDERAEVELSIEQIISILQQ